MTEPIKIIGYMRVSADEQGEPVANITISMAQWEQCVISQALDDARVAHVGRKSNVPRATMELIGGLRAAGLSWQKIADALTKQGVPTSQGGAWHGTTVRKLAAKAKDTTT